MGMWMFSPSLDTSIEPYIHSLPDSILNSQALCRHAITVFTWLFEVNRDFFLARSMFGVCELTSELPRGIRAAQFRVLDR